MSGRGGRSGMNSFRTNLHKAEDKIRNEQYEHLLLIDSKGNVSREAGDNNTSQVNVPEEMIRMSVDGVMTHNHPRGTTFSWQDVQTALTIGLKEIRATTANNGTYVLRRNYKLSDPQPMMYKSFGMGYRYNCDKIHETIQGRINRGEIDISEAGKLDAQMRRDWLKNNAKNFGWTYREEKK